MNKRGQIYILAAVVLCVAIYGVITITNKIEPPSDVDNFDFYVENFVGERAYVMDLGYLEDKGASYYLTENLGDGESDSENKNLLKLFTELGFNVGVVLIDYNKDEPKPWIIINYLNQDVITTCEGCDKSALPSAQEELGGLSFSLTGEGKKFFLGISNLDDLTRGGKYFVKKYGDSDSVDIFVDGNKYTFDRPEGDKVESILFKNLEKDYVKVVKV